MPSRRSWMFVQLLVLALGPPSASAAAIPPGRAIDEVYRAEFGQCDSTNVFEGVHFPIRNSRGAIKWYDCRDKSRLTRFEEIPASGQRPRAIIFTAKLARDQDGSRQACDNPGHTDQCGTSLMMKPTAGSACPLPLRSEQKCVPVDADTVPYVAIPASGPPLLDRAKFQRLTGVHMGDFGVVAAGGKVVPVIVADAGPAYKIGEGSTALLKALSSDGSPRTIASGVTFILFPGSARAVTPDNIAKLTREVGSALYARLEK